MRTGQVHSCPPPPNEEAVYRGRFCGPGYTTRGFRVYCLGLKILGLFLLLGARCRFQISPAPGLFPFKTRVTFILFFSWLCFSFQVQHSAQHRSAMLKLPLPIPTQPSMAIST